MRNVIFTEAQFKRIMDEGTGGYLSDIKNSGEIPQNGYGTEVFVNNTDRDALSDVTIGDKIAKGKQRQNRLFARSRIYEGDTLDNMKNSGYGMKSDKFISNQSQGGGKMINNVNNEINGGGGSRNNTNQVRLSRLRDQKDNDPMTYLRNGGKQTEKILQRSINKNSEQNSRNREIDKKFENLFDTNTPNPNKGINKGHHKEEPTIYYY